MRCRKGGQGWALLQQVVWTIFFPMFFFFRGPMSCGIVVECSVDRDTSLPGVHGRVVLDRRWRVLVVPVSELFERPLHRDPEVEEEEGGDEHHPRRNSAHDVRDEEEADGGADAGHEEDDDDQHLVHEVGDHEAALAALDARDHEDGKEHVDDGADGLGEEGGPDVVLDDVKYLSADRCVELLRLHELVDLELDVFHVVFDRVELLDAEQVREEHGQLEAGEDHGHDTQEDGPKVDGHAAAALAHDEGGNGRDRTRKRGDGANCTKVK
jgi:hypothetical protein